VLNRTPNTLFSVIGVNYLLLPAGLLPSCTRAFDTPLGRSDLSSRLEFATGRSGAYPDGTFTR
jgi:hypothetical protein